MVEIRDLRMGSPVPNFRLPSSRGTQIELRDYRHRMPVVLFFMHEIQCETCRNLVEKFKNAYFEYQLEKVEVLILAALSENEAKYFTDSMSLPFPVLADPDRRVFEMYLEGFAAGLFVLDRYNAQQVKMIAADADELMTPDEASSWAVFSETTCPECGVLEWPQSD